MFDLADFDLDQLAVVFLATLLGGVVGYDRQCSNKPAGIRTHALVAAASSLMVLLAHHLTAAFQQQSTGATVSADPVRVIQAIVVGIGFLGAGTIIQDREKNVAGLTTAASILLTAGIGVTVAVGRTWLAIEITLLALVVLASVRWAEKLAGGSICPDGDQDSPKDR